MKSSLRQRSLETLARAGVRTELGDQELDLSLLERNLPADDELADRLIHAYQQIPRELFFDETVAQYARHDVALPIGFDQSSSKPSTLFRLIALGEPAPAERVLEIGAGCGYLLALLAALYPEKREALKLFGMEKRVALITNARRNLDQLKFHDILLTAADGLQGWREHSPFDLIIVSAAVTEVPQALLMQLSLGGRLIVPVVIGRELQELHLFRRISTTSGPRLDFEVERCGECNFVLAI